MRDFSSSSKPLPKRAQATLSGKRLRNRTRDFRSGGKSLLERTQTAQPELHKLNTANFEFQFE